MEVAAHVHRFQDASEEQWFRFCKQLAVQEMDEVSDSGFLGRFAIGARRLQDLGLMDGVKKVDFEGTKIYMGEFVSPLTLERFLSEPKIQYAIFKRSMEEYRDGIESSGLAAQIGQNIGGEPLTMSGLLGLASQAGIKGAKSWLSKPKDRTRFPHTTQTFLHTNGIF